MSVPIDNPSADAGTVLAGAMTDDEDRLVSADDPLSGLQLRSGGEIPGDIAVPALLETVRKARRYGLKLARSIVAQDGQEAVTAWVEVSPRQDGAGGCDILLRNWHATPLTAEDPDMATRRRSEIDRELADLSARLDAGQRVLAVDVTAEAPDLGDLRKAMESGIGRPWTDFVTMTGNGFHQPMHWRLLDGAHITIPGSDRTWRASLLPREVPGSDPAGFELYLTALEPLPPAPVRAAEANGRDDRPPMARPGLLGRDVAPVLRQPIARIIANAETIRTRLAGPLAAAYADYASDIASAGQHLLALLDDLSDLEVVEAEDFATAPDRIDVADVARRAAGILAVRARERGIIIEAPEPGESAGAIAEFRRVLQVLLNLIGNAIRYSTANSQIWVRLDRHEDRVFVTVADEGPGLSMEEQARVFEKFERLGRSGDGGSGLGLYISRRIARAMGGELSVESTPGKGARFILELPGAPAMRHAGNEAGTDEFRRHVPQIPRLRRVED